MKFAKSGLMFLSAALMSGCGQDTTETLNNAIAMAKAKMADSASAAPKTVVTSANTPEPSTELLQLKQQLKQAQQQLANSNTALIAARNKLKAKNQQPKSLQQEQMQLKKERKVVDATSRHVKLLEKQLSRQDTQLMELQKTLLDTETGCREVAEQLARTTRKSS